MLLLSVKLPVFLFLLALLTHLPLLAQPDVSRVVVSDSLLRKHVFSLAADSLEGRQTGTTGQHKAALYCTQAFRFARLLPVFRLDSVRGSFRQTFALTVSDVQLFGNMRVYGTGATTYKRYELAPLPITAKDSSRVLLGHNVAGLLIGTDLKQEVVVISAHYDHLGRQGRQIFHGADDNASGTATVLSVAATFDSLARHNSRPRRSVLFVLFSGEELGLFGSDYFIVNSPIPVQQFVGNINVDMVGRVDAEHHRKPDYCYVLTGKENNRLLPYLEKANQQSIQLAVNQGGYDTENDPEQLFYRSDHYNFAKFGIPVLFFTSGTHPDYHKTSDTAERILYPVLQKRATLIFQTAWLLANE